MNKNEEKKVTEVIEEVMPEERIILGRQLSTENVEASRSFFDAAEGNIGKEVYIKLSEVGASLVGHIYTNKPKDSGYIETSKVANMDRLPKEEIDTEFGKTATTESLKALSAYGFKATVVGKQGTMVAIKIAPKKTKKPVEVEVVKKSSNETVKQLIDKGVLSKEELDERIAYLKQHQITEKDTLFVPALLLIWKQEEGFEVAKPKKLYLNPNPRQESLIKRIVRNLVLGDPVILEGPKACGKNVAWESISWLFNRPLEVLNCDGKMTKSSMFGSPTTDYSNKEALNRDGAKEFINIFFTSLMSSLKGAFSFFFKKKTEAEENVEESYDKAADFLVNTIKCASPDIKLEKGPVTRALVEAEKRGTILIADEMNLSDPNTLAGAFNALTDKHTLAYQVNGLGLVKISAGLIIGATQNGTGGEYIGTKKQNDATMSRFNCIRISAPDSIKSILENNKFDIDEEYYDVLDKIYGKFARAAKVSRSVSESCLNVRGFERACGHIATGQPVLDAVCECVIYTCDKKDEAILVEEVKGQIPANMK